MKPIKIAKLVAQIASAALFLTSILLCAIDVTSANTAFLALITAYGSIVVFAVVGAFLITSASDISRRIGHGLVISSYAVGLTAAISLIEDSSAAIVMLIAAIMLALYYLCVLLMVIMQKDYPLSDDPAADPRIVHLKEWKKLMEDGIISAEEYEGKRCKILGIEPKKKNEETK